jgi:hypothetical protein
MLLIGYDFPKKEFFFKDHYNRFRKVSYASVEAHATTFTIVLDVKDPYNPGPSKEEMWMGEWKLKINGGDNGVLVIRRTRVAPNAMFDDAAISGAHLRPISSTLWARVGSLYIKNKSNNTSTKRVVYGRLNGSDGNTMELSIDWSTTEKGADPLSVIRQGYHPKGPIFKLRLFTAGDFAAFYAVGEGYNADQLHNPCGVLMYRPGKYPKNLGSFLTNNGIINRAVWMGRYAILIDGHKGKKPTYLTLLSSDGFKTLTGTYIGRWGKSHKVTGSFIKDHNVRLRVDQPIGDWLMNLYFHRFSKNLITGTQSTTITPHIGHSVFGQKKQFQLIRFRKAKK